MQLPFVSLAPWPRFLPAVWKALKPAVDTGDYFQAAERLQADAYTRMFNYFYIPDLRARAEEDSPAKSRELSDLVELFQVRAALFLLFFALEARAMGGPVGCPRSPAPAPVRPLFPKVQWQDPSLERDLNPHSEGMRAALQSSFLNPEYQALCRWPAFFDAYSSCLQPVLESPLYTDWQLSTRSLAWHLAQELPVAVELSSQHLSRAGLKQQDLSAVAEMIDLFLKNLSGLLLNMAVARIGLEKGSRPSAAPAPREKAASLDSGRVA